MADDPNRDLLPVKESCRQQCNSQKLKPANCMSSVPSYSTFGEDSKDLQQRHYVTKMERDELEDRFLRLMEDHQQMKKKCNAQEEKIKRLATKLLRIVSDRDRALKSASDRRDHHAVDRLDEMQARINDLENCNQQLHERIMVLKTQLGTHSKLHAAVHYSANSLSPTITGRSRPCSRAGACPEQDTVIKQGNDTWDQHGESKGILDSDESLRRKIKNLEQEIAAIQEQHKAKISQLEQQLSYFTAEEQRNRASENIEMIRLRREMKSQSLQMEALKAQSDLEMERVQSVLQDYHSQNSNLSQELDKVLSSNQGLVEQLSEAKGMSENTRDLEDQLSDLQLEQQSLKLQNSQLLEIASKTISPLSQAPEEGSLNSSNNSSPQMNSDIDLDEIYGEMQKIRDLSTEECRNPSCGDVANKSAGATNGECCDSNCDGLAQRNMGAYQSGKSDFTANDSKQAFENPPLDAVDSHTKAHNRLCTCDVKNRKDYYPPCACGCSKCKEAQLSKKGPHSKTRKTSRPLNNGAGKKTPITETFSEQYLQHQDLASSSNQNTSSGEIYTGSEQDQCDKECTDTCSNYQMKIPSKAGPSTAIQGKQGNKPPSVKTRQAILPPKAKPGKQGLKTSNTKALASALSVNHADILHELEVCKELLRVQCSLNTSFKNELTKLYAEIGKLEGSTSSSLLSGNTEIDKTVVQPINRSAVARPCSRAPASVRSPDGVRRKSLLRVGEGEGLFEIHAHCIELTDDGSILVPAGRGMFLTWSFYDQDVAYTPLKMGPKAEINTSAVYRVLVNDAFLAHLYKEACCMDLHASKGDSSELIGRGMLTFSEILDFPQNKIHSSVRLLSIKPCEEDRTLGMLQCWFRLSCELSIINRFNDGLTPSPKSKASPDLIKKSDLNLEASEENLKSLDHQSNVSEASDELLALKSSKSTKEPNEFGSIDDGSSKESSGTYKSQAQMMEDEIAESTKKLRDADSEVSNATKLQMMEVLEEDSWNHETSAIDEEKLDKVAAERKSITDSMDTISDTEIDEPLILNIEIHSFMPDLSLNLYQSTNVIQLYVEFKFLGLSGHELETQSVEVESGNLVYHYKKSFNYSAADQQKMLADMYRGTTWHDSALQFVIVSEPQEDTEQDCEEIGFADIDMQLLIRKGQDMMKSEVVVYGADGHSPNIGKLCVTIEGMRTCRKAIRLYLKKNPD